MKNKNWIFFLSNLIKIGLQIEKFSVQMSSDLTDRVIDITGNGNA